MKMLIIFTLAALTFLCGVYAIPKGHLLGKEKCTWGPGYWCSNLTSAAGCHAVKHCIQTVWEHKTYPEDNDSVCSVCLDMVKQARDQLESNETQEEIKEVFEGSCKLIPLKVISNECCKIADDFIPELIETLASQMNPQIVCSIAGLCNNEHIDKLLEEHYDEVITKHPPPQKVDACTGCHKVVDLLESRFNDMPKDEFLKSLLQVCGRMGSLADGCSDIVITYFSTIYEYMQGNFNSNNVCLLSGECYTNFHIHKIEITPMSVVGVVAVSDDLPCDFCKQLIGHLRDLLIADTTEEEFKKVLEGLCKQSGRFKDQCSSIVEEYYGVIYQFLVSELNSTALCEMINICPQPTLEEAQIPIAPLLPPESASQAIKLNQRKLVRVGLNKDTSNVKLMNAAFNKQTPEIMQLPIERFNSPNVNNLYNKELCVFCEYFLHYMQQVITEPKTEKRIKEEVDKVCKILPSSVNNTCIQFVENYGDAFVAIFVQEIDPSTICPLLQVCPTNNKNTDIEVFMQSTPRDKPNCPLCLFAVTKLEEMIKDRKTKTDIKNALGTLCSHLSGNIAEECQDFVNTYTDELVEMLIDDFKPQEVCVYLKLCKDETPAPELTDIKIDGMISTNEIPDFTANGKVIKPALVKGDKPECVLCEFVMEKLQHELENKTTEDEIKHAIHSICNDLPKSIRNECNNFVDKYADTVFQLIIASVEPKELCTIMKLCNGNSDYIENIETPACPICKVVMSQIEDWLIGSNITEAEVKKALLKVCQYVPRHQRTDCDQFIETYGDKIYKALMMLISPGDICSMIFLCDDKESIKTAINECAVCENTVDAMDKILLNPRANHSLGHVLQKSCRGLPIDHQKTCNKLMEKNGEAIYNMVSHSSDHQNICKEVGICNNNFIARPILL